MKYTIIIEEDEFDFLIKLIEGVYEESDTVGTFIRRLKIEELLGLLYNEKKNQNETDWNTIKKIFSGNTEHF